jgi:hypothetical protein
MKTKRSEGADKESSKLPSSAEDVPGNDEATREAAGAIPEKPRRRQPAEGNDSSVTEGDYSKKGKG